MPSSGPVFLLLCVIGLVHAGYNEDLARSFLLYSTVTYCANTSLVQSWSCNACYKDLYFQQAALVKDNNTNTFGFIGTTRIESTPVSHAIVIAFRGTNPSDLKNIKVDINALQDSVDNITVGAKVHSGFWNAWQNLAVVLRPELKKLLAWYKQVYAEGCDPLWPQRPAIYFTGHSLGAALATCAAADLLSDGTASDHPVHLYTFGSPRVGNKAFAQYLDDHLTDSWRVVHYRDPVPRLPPLNYFIEYNHVEKGVLYNELSTSYQLCLTDGENDTCNPFYFNAQVSDHLKYLNVDVGSFCLDFVPPNGTKFIHDLPGGCPWFHWRKWMWGLVAAGIVVVAVAIVSGVIIHRRFKRRHYQQINP